MGVRPPQDQERKREREREGGREGEQTPISLESPKFYDSFAEKKVIACDSQRLRLTQHGEKFPGEKPKEKGEAVEVCRQFDLSIV